MLLLLPVHVVSLPLELVGLAVLDAVLLLGERVQVGGLALDEAADLLGDQLLLLQLLLEELDALLELGLAPVVDALVARVLALGLALAVLHVELCLGLAFVDLLLQVEDLLVVL